MFIEIKYREYSFMSYRVINKRYFTIEKQKARYFVEYSKCLSDAFPFYSTKKINPFLNLITSTNHEKGEEF